MKNTATLKADKTTTTLTSSRTHSLTVACLLLEDD